MCPDIEDIPGAINGFGLLQAVQHIGRTGKTLFNFIHFSIQEYLAAYCRTKLPPLQELQILKDKFWFNNYLLNTFTVYLALTKGQRPSFKNFIFDGNKTINISQGFLKICSFCFHLYNCLYEAGNKLMCESTAKEKIFDNKIIRKIYPSSPTFMEC